MMTIKVPNVSDFNNYRKMKIRMLTKDFRIKLTEEEQDKLNEADNEFAVDRLCRDIIKRALD